MRANNAINADGLGQRAFGASPNPAGYGERWTVLMMTPKLRYWLLVIFAMLQWPVRFRCALDKQIE